MHNGRKQPRLFILDFEWYIKYTCIFFVFVYRKIAYDKIQFSDLITYYSSSKFHAAML